MILGSDSTMITYWFIIVDVLIGLACDHYHEEPGAISGHDASGNSVRTDNRFAMW
jgi:hypothetical protein